MNLSKLCGMLFFAVSLVSCATPYQKVTAFTVTGGYYDELLPTGEYKVGFGGNGYTSATTARDYAFLRSAQITLEQGKTFFEVMQGGGGKEDHAFWTGYSVSYASSNTAEYIIKLHDVEPTDSDNPVFNALDTKALVMKRNSLNDNYKVQKTSASSVK